MSSKFAQLHVNIVAPSDLLTEDRRLAIYRHFGLVAGQGVFIQSRCYFEHPGNLSNVSLGDNCFLNHECFLDNGAEIAIAPNTRIAPRVSILTTTHETGFPVTARGAIRKPVKIGCDCWIGTGVIVLPGVTIGDCVTVGCGSVVNRDIPSGTIYAGVPARFIREHPAKGMIAVNQCSDRAYVRN